MTRGDAELQNDMQRPRQSHPPSAYISGRGGGSVRGRKVRGGGGGVLPNRRKSGSDHHCLEACGPSNRRHKLS